MKKILLLGNNDRSFLSTTRLLGKEYHLTNIYFSKKNFANYSKYIKKSIYFEDPTKDLNNFEKGFLKHIKNEKYTFIFPMNDIANEILFKNYHILKQYTRLIFPERETFEFVKNKKNLLELCKKIGLPQKEYRIISKKNWKEIIKETTRFPRYIKPISSAIIKNNKIMSFSVKKIKNKHQLEEYIRENIENIDLILQEPIKGYGIGFNIIAKKGKILNYTITKRLHEPKDGGGSSYRMSLPLNNKLERYAKKILKELDYTGLAMIEFKYNEDENEYYLMEINQRVWGSIELSVISNVPFQKDAILLYSGKKVPKREYSPYKYARHLSKDIYWLLRNTLDKRNVVVPLIWIKELARIFTKKERWDVERLEDPLPILIHYLELLKKIIDKGIYGIKLLTYKLIIPKKQKEIDFKKEKILIMCKGNINRSAFAKEYLLQKYGIKTESCGTINKTGRMTTKISEIVAKEKFNVDLSNHRSKSIYDIRKEIDSFDKIIIFDTQNYLFIKNNFPQYLKKVTFLGEEIRDPYRKTKKEYIKIYKKISVLLNNLIKNGKIHYST